MSTSEFGNIGILECRNVGLSTNASGNLVNKPIDSILHHSIIPLLFIILFSSWGSPSPAFADSPSARDIINKVQDKYNRTEDAVIKFTQTVKYPLSKLSKTTEGTMYLKKGNMYRIDTGDRVIVTDGKTSWIYTPASNQVIIDKFRDDKNTITPNQFLLDVPANYFAVLLSTNKQGGETTYTLKLTPKSDNSFIRGIVIVVSNDWTIRSADVSDMNDIKYIYNVDSIKLNTGLPDSEFEFVPPKGAQVVDLRNR